MLEKGKRVGEYVLLEKLGAGGFGDVWKAEKRTVLDVNHFALKFFRPKEDGVDFDKIGRELAVWKRLRGLPHIISVIELDRFEDYVYVVSDFADGGSLEKFLKNKPSLSETEAIRIALEILTGLENLHEKGFVHRDLKPDNILIMNGRFCLADFGISREVKTHSRATGTAGTMEYMPPEAFEKTPSVTPQTDIWAVGAILQRLLTGKLPYPQDDQPSLIAAILMSEPDEMPESVSTSLRDIVRKALQKNRAMRFQSASDMRETLQEILKTAQKVVESDTDSQIRRHALDKTVEFETAHFQKIDSSVQKDENEIQTVVRQDIVESFQHWRGFEEEDAHQKMLERPALLNSKLSPKKSNAPAFLWILGIIGAPLIILFTWIIMNDDTLSNNSNVNAASCSKFASDSATSINLQPCKVGSYYGFSDPSGKLVLSAVYENAYSFDEGTGLAAVKRGNWGYIDSQGRVKITFQFAQAAPFDNGYAKVAIGENSFTIDKNGKRVSDIKTIGENRPW